MLWLPGTHLGRCAGNGTAIRHRGSVHRRKRKLLYLHGTGHEPPPFLENWPLATWNLLIVSTPCKCFPAHCHLYPHPLPVVPSRSLPGVFFSVWMDVRKTRTSMTCSLIINFRFSLLFVSGIEKCFWQTVDFLSPHLRWCWRVCERSVQPSSSRVLRIVLMFIFRTPETLTAVYAYIFKDPKCSETDSLAFLTVSSRWGVRCDEVAKVAVVQLVGYRGSSSASPPGSDMLFSGCYSVYFTSYMCWQRWWCGRAARRFLLCGCTQECRDNPGMLENSCVMPKLQGSHLSTT